MTRRNAFKAALAFLAYPFAAKADTPAGITIPIHADMSPFREKVRQAIEDAVGKTHPKIEGVLGETYFHVRQQPRFPADKRIYLNGVDVTDRACESDCVGGWCRLYDVDAVGKCVPLRGTRIHRGRVEIADRPRVFIRQAAPTFSGSISIPVNV